MLRARLRLLISGLLPALTACSAPSPPIVLRTSKTTPSPTAAAATTAPTTDSAPDTPSNAMERIEAWEQAAPGKGRKERFVRADFGNFVASRCDSSSSPCAVGAVATDTGLLTGVSWDGVLAADKDIDGDGRADLIATKPTLGAPADWHGLVIIADRPEGPVEISIQGVEPGDWQDVELDDSPGRTLTVRKQGSSFEKQVFTWDGHGLVSKDVVLLRWSSNEASSTPGTNWQLEAIAGGKTLTRGHDSVAHKNEMSPPGGLLDLHGDGERYYMVEFKSYLSPELGMTVETSQIVLELRPEGWADVAAPLFDPDSQADRNNDGVPEFECTLGEVALVTCDSVASDCNTWSVRPSAFAGWDGKKLSARAKSLKALYASWLPDALTEVASFKGTPTGASCPHDRVESVSKLYLARRWSGVDGAKAESEVNALMKGVSFAACAGPDGEGRKWSDVWKNLKNSLQAATP